MARRPNVRFTRAGLVQVDLSADDVIKLEKLMEIDGLRSRAAFFRRLLHVQPATDELEKLRGERAHHIDRIAWLIDEGVKNERRANAAEAKAKGLKHDLELELRVSGERADELEKSLRRESDARDLLFDCLCVLSLNGADEDLLSRIRAVINTHDKEPTP